MQINGSQRNENWRNGRPRNEYWRNGRQRIRNWRKGRQRNETLEMEGRGMKIGEMESR